MSVFKHVALNNPLLLLRFFLKRIPSCITSLRLRILELRMRLSELRMSRKKSLLLCLKRGYFARNEANLRSNRVLCCPSVNHPVEVINIFLECFHKVRASLTTNDPSSATRPAWEGRLSGNEVAPVRIGSGNVAARAATGKPNRPNKAQTETNR